MSRVVQDSGENRTTRYTIESIRRACDVLEAFRKDGEALRLCDLASRVGLSKATTFRILFTLEQRGFVEQTGDRAYRLTFCPVKRRKYRFGYGAQSAEFSFSRTVCESIQRAACEEGIELFLLNNRYSAKTAVRNADLFIREHVNLVIEFQTDDHSASIISSKLQEAHIPLIAIEIPHPGATYYGANNYQAGLLGGRYLAKWAIQNWAGEVDELLLLELSMAGPLPRSRLTGTAAGLREALPYLKDSQIVSVNGNGQFEQSMEVVRKYLRKRSCRRVLVAGVNDPSAIGALRAFEEAGRADDCAVMGQNASAEARSEMRQPRSRLIGSVGYFPERYGDALIPLALDIVQGKPTPPAVFVHHRLVTRENVDRFYPHDAQRSRSELDCLLLGCG